ncbi:tannase/feruloyl esterase family alpha/beta hydrolase [Ramlibacter montanisoli]|uniref:Tannase/feruloyl esterase family alpha/beta hydrolase n=1 Tax=Ramlibacter montanisoli TaxID=2732512 RepID=A0A849KEF0_9BURK|nr:tannase/feruloyl esterase family alpha/beta hydrolase [Ramlibacter montanisoli]NNU42583.1 tannase/feruloyl esterase family alpha/beta hydrolase [Ramlibacter montanisoli]
MIRTATVSTLATLALLAGCSTTTNIPVVTPASIAPLAYHPQAFCDGLVGQRISPVDIGLPSGYATIDSASLLAATEMRVLERGPTPAATIVPAMPQRCKVLGHIAPVDPQAPVINFQVNLPVRWNHASVQYGGGGFNGVLISGEALVPAARFDQLSPLAQGFVTYGTDSGHQNKPGEPPQAFAMNDEALVNFAHASYKKVRDVAVAIMRQAYGVGPRKLYFVGSSEGGREGLTMAQRYPRDFHGILSRVPVIHWTGLQHAGLRDGLALTKGGWMNPAQVKLVHDAVLAACDAADGAADAVVSDPVGCRTRFDVNKLRCTGAQADSCLTEPQIRAVQTLHTPLDMGMELANGLRRYPGRGPSGEGTPSSGPTGGWQSWWTGSAAPAFPPVQANGIAWFYGGGAIQYFYARNPQLDLRTYRAADHAARIRQVSELMDSTNPDLSAFRAHGGKLILLENLGDYAQSPYAGIEYHASVVQRMGRAAVDSFFKLYTAPGVDHVGTGAPGNADLFPALVAWVDQGRAPAGLTLVEQDARPPFAVKRSRPLCEWPQVPRYRAGDINAAGSFACAP